MHKCIVGIACMFGLMASAFAEEVFPSLSAEDVMAFLDASYAKVYVETEADARVVLSVTDKDNVVRAESKPLMLGSSGKGELFIGMAISDGFHGRQEGVRMVFRWFSPPYLQTGKIAFKKFWNFRKGNTFTDGNSDDLPSSTRIYWNTKDVPRCTITHIQWSKEFPVQSVENIQRVGAIVLERYPRVGATIK